MDDETLLMEQFRRLKAADPQNKVWLWAPEFGGRNDFPPPEKNELVLSIEMGRADTVPFQSKPNTPF